MVLEEQKRSMMRAGPTLGKKRHILAKKGLYKEEIFNLRLKE